MPRLTPLLFSFFLVATAYAQPGPYGSPLDVPNDPQSIGMGESLTAFRANTAALMYNPAGLAGLKGVSVSYAQRKMNWDEMFGDMAFHGASLAVETPVGVFGARYDRFSLGTFDGAVTTEELQAETNVTTTIYQHDFAVGFGDEIVNGLAAGIEAKYYDYVLKISPSEFNSVASTTPAILFDGGLIYTLPSLHSQEDLRDHVSIGISLQNIGTKFKIQPARNTTEQEPPPEVAGGALAQYLRLGFSYDFSFFSPREGGLSPLSGAVTGEYRNIINRVAPADVKVFWGFGGAITFYEVLTLRGGGVILPFDGILGDMNKVAYRYGTGVTLPLERLGIPLPFTVSANYSAIPLRDIGFSFSGSQQRMLLDTFSFELHYTEGL